jgi:hypothetical protein
MPTNFPTSVDNFTNPTANDSLNLPSHSTQHANANDAIEAIETTLFAGGINYTGLVLLATAAPSASTAIQFDNAFNSTYLNYKIVWNLTMASSNDLFFKYRTSGSDLSTGYASTGIVISSLTGAVNAYGANTGTGAYISQIGTSRVAGEIEILSPSISGQNRHTVHKGQGLNGVHYGGSYNLSAGSIDGFVLSAFGVAMTGFVKLYGYRNA